MAKMNLDKKNILVTGGAGFIGSHLCERLLEEGHRVICIDNFSTGSLNNIESLLQIPDFRFLRLDVNAPINLESFEELSAFKIPFQGIQEIYHLAAPTSIKNFEEHKIETLLAHSLGNYYTLELAKKYKARILLGSSSVVYGDREEGETFIDESKIGLVNHLSPRACYDEGKRFSETMFETYRQVHGLDIRIARIFRTYGPRMPLFDGHLIPDFVLNALEGKELVIYGGEDFRSSLVYVSDVVDALVRMMQNQKDMGPVNIGSDEDVKLADVAKKIIEMTSSNSQITYEPSLPFLSELGLPNTKKSRELGWIPLTRLDEGLSKTIEYIKANKLLLTNI